jgi:heme a synthase
MSIVSKKITSAYGWLVVEIWLLIALGGAVRAMNAGLACPDWPLCFGDYIPDYHPQVYFEFIHRVMAGLIGIVSVWLAVLMFRNPKVSKTLKWLVAISLVTLAAQIILGGLTVLWLLHEKVVAAHLMLASFFIGMNLWIYMACKQPDESVNVIPGLARFVLSVLAALGVQILLGGLVASHYAGVICTDFPLCHGQWIPTLNGTLGLHVIHRLGAYLLTTLVIGLYFWSRQFGPGEFHRIAAWMLVVVLWQVCVGIANVVFLTPPLITVIHLASAMTILCLGMRLLYLSRYALIAKRQLPEYRADEKAQPFERPQVSYTGQ